ncbi:hypothetical protein ACOME3_007191 [Neoechinorhynchus agilis]
MRPINFRESVPIPSEVAVVVRNREVTAKGPKGALTRSFKHSNVDIRRSGKRVFVEKWFGNKKELATVRSILGHINNMIKGVHTGFRLKMKGVYVHFPINFNILDDGSVLEIRNFLGEKVVRRVKMTEGVKVSLSPDVKMEIILEGTCIQSITQSASRIHQSVLIRKKDTRNFLDGIYVSEKAVCIED